MEVVMFLQNTGSYLLTRKHSIITQRTMHL